MPNYTFICDKCGDELTEFLTMDNYRERLCACTGNLSGMMKRKYTVPQINSGFKEYFDIGLNKMITSKKQIKEIEKKENKVWGDDKELRQESELNRKNNERLDTEKFKRESIPKIMKTLYS